MMTDKQIRLDKWLWAARFYKTRSLAKQAIEGGKVHYNNARSRPSKNVEPGALVRLRSGWDEKTVEILELSDQRRGAPEAQKLYVETDESIKKREVNAVMRKSQSMANQTPEKRPTKKQRRDIHKFKDDQSQQTDY